MVENNIPMDLLSDSGPMRRQTERVDCSTEVEFRLENGKAYGPYTGWLHDISLGGARILARGGEAVALPTHQFKLFVKMKEGPLADTDFIGQVVHVRPGEEDLAIGMKFAEIEEPQRERLHAYIEDLMP